MSLLMAEKARESDIETFEPLAERAEQILQKAGRAVVGVAMASGGKVSLGKSQHTPRKPYLITIQNPSSGADKGLAGYFFGEHTDDDGRPIVQVKIDMLVAAGKAQRVVSYPTRAVGFDESDYAHINQALSALEGQGT